MSSWIEERLARDITELTGGVVVTESNLREARNALEDRIESNREQRRRSVVAAAAAAVLIPALGFAAFQTLSTEEKTAPPANSGPPDVADSYADFLIGDAPTPELVDGLWRVDNGYISLLFGEDGTVRFDNHGTLFSNPTITGTYEIDGDLIAVTTTDSQQAECIGEQFAMRVSIPQVGGMRFVHADASSSACAPMRKSQRWVLEQVLPTSQGLAELVFSKDSGWRATPDKVALYGVWLAEGGGYVLEIDRGGSYYVADGSGDPVDRGQWSLRTSDLTLTSSAASGECSEGDRLVLGGLEQVTPNTTAIRGTVKQNTCGGAWTPRTWILIPHEGS